MKCPPYKFLAFGSGELLSSLPIRPLTFHIFDFFSETTEGILIKLDRKQVLKVLYQVCSFQPDWPRGGSRVGQNMSKKVPPLESSSLELLHGLKNGLFLSNLHQCMIQVCIFHRDLNMH